MNDDLEITYTWCFSPERLDKIDVSKKLFCGDELVDMETIEGIDKPDVVDYGFMERLFK